MHETAGLNTYLDDYIMDCQCVPGPHCKLLQFGVLSSISACTCFSIPVRKVTLASSESEQLKFHLLGLGPPSVVFAAPGVSQVVKALAQTTRTARQTGYLLHLTEWYCQQFSLHLVLHVAVP